ncbi:hypothetical protein BOTBODRAFT_77139, partial [Botryobasidium botryosum FD-172 SS1]
AFEIACRKWKIPLVKILPYNKQANGIAEQGHIHIRLSLLKACGEGNSHKWPSLLSAALYADRVTIRKSTGVSPYKLVYGTDPVLPLDLYQATFMVENWPDNMDRVDLLALRIAQIDKKDALLDQAASRLFQARFQSREYFIEKYSDRIKFHSFKIGDKVLVENSSKSILEKKFHPRYIGPYILVEEVAKGGWKIRELDGTESRYPVAARRLKPFWEFNSM